MNGAEHELSHSLAAAQNKVSGHRFNIPNCLAHLKVDPRGYPIPFFIPYRDGQPDFKFMCPVKQNRAIDESLCHVCGKKLNKDYVYFITGPVGLQNTTVSDPGMHRECAEFAMQVCPHMLFQKAQRKTEGSDAVMDLIHVDGKPDHLFLIKASKWWAKFYKEIGYRLIHFRVHSTEKYSYTDNRLHKDTTP